MAPLPPAKVVVAGVALGVVAVVALAAPLFLLALVAGLVAVPCMVAVPCLAAGLAGMALLAIAIGVVAGMVAVAGTIGVAVLGVPLAIFLTGRKERGIVGWHLWKERLLLAVLSVRAAVRRWRERPAQGSLEWRQAGSWQLSPQSNDSFYFHGTGPDGTELFTRLAIRAGGRAEGWMVIYLPLLGVLRFDSQELRYEEGEADPITQPLRFHCLKPLEKWRILFNGECQGSHAKHMVEVDLVWEAETEPFDFDMDISSKPLARAISRQPWSVRFFRELKRMHQRHYEQWGYLKGVVSIDKCEQEVSLRGVRDRSFGIRDWGYIPRWVFLVAALEDGSCFNCTLVHHPLSGRMCLGYLWDRKQQFRLLDEATEIQELGEDDPMNPPSEFEFRFHIQGRGWVHAKACIDHRIMFDMGQRSVFHEQFARFEIDGVRGRGICEFAYGEKHRPRGWKLPSELETQPNLTVRYHTTFWLDRKNAVRADSHLLEYLGGKAFGLHALYSGDFKVPQAFCITSSAFKLQIHQSSIGPQLLQVTRQLHDAELIENLEEREHMIESCCQRAQALFLSVDMLPELERQIIRSYVELSDKAGQQKATVAVRSSATAEDLPSASFAGQHDTLLGITGETELLTAIRKVWASMWAHRAVAYRQRNKIDHASVSMCVVVQQFIEAQSSGVIFTMNPVNGDRSQIVITSNFGVGESVVSGVVTPDTFVVERTDDGLRVCSARISQKSKVFTSTPEDASVSLRDAHSDMSAAKSLTTRQVLSLAHSAIEIEQFMKYANGVDVEFAVLDDVEYMLQARPITTAGSKKTPEEQDLLTKQGWSCMRELDTEIKCEEDVYTKHNIGEMLPGAVTPLTYSTFGVSLDIAMRKFYGQTFFDSESSSLDRGREHLKFVGYFYGHLFLNMTQLYRVIASMLGGSKEDIDFSLCGYITDLATPTPPPPPDNLLHKFGFSVSFFLFRLFYLLRFLGNLYFVPHHIAVLRKRLESVPIFSVEASQGGPEDGEWRRTLQLYELLTVHLADLDLAYETHLWSSAVSATWQGQLLRLLGGKTKENQETLAKLLTGIGNVASADVLLALDDVVQQLADQLARGEDCILADNKASQDEKLSWLMKNEAFRRFLREHGHRAFREAEMRQQGWTDDPRPIVAMLLTSLRAKIAATERTDRCSKDAPTLPALHPLMRLLLSKGITKTSQGIRQREETKSLCVQLQQQLKKGYCQLACRLTKVHDILPDEDTIYFFTHEELRELISHGLHGRHVIQELVEKACERRKLLPTLQKLQFSNMSQPGAIPIPLDFQDTSEATQTYCSGEVLEGMGVSAGVVVGRARVIIDIDQATYLEKGEILICPFTDVAWTPVFSLIGGVASDIGGLISHGAVVAREYGLPCVVDLCNATKRVRTGDVVQLDGSKGTLTILSEGKVKGIAKVENEFEILSENQVPPHDTWRELLASSPSLVLVK